MVNTFLVHPDYAISAKVLDRARLGKQRVECAQIIDAITALKENRAEKRGWTNHPATRSWVDNLDSLKLYFNAVVSEWIARGGANNYELYTDIDPNTPKPYWADCAPVHYSHMAQLTQKDPRYYSEENLKDKVPPEMLEYFLSMPEKYKSYGYIWPYKYSRWQLVSKDVEDLAEPYADRPRCQHPNCRFKSSYGDRCGVHRDKSIDINAMCQGSYKNGNLCRSKAKYGSSHCGSHGGVALGSTPVSAASSSSASAAASSPSRPCSATCKTGKPCRNRAKAGSDVCHVHVRL